MEHRLRAGWPLLEDLKVPKRPPKQGEEKDRGQASAAHLFRTPTCRDAP
jgi:hypothetical protein